MPDYRGSKIISNKGRSLKRARKGELLPAVTEYRVLTESRYGVSLVECKPVTGYKHQVRYESCDDRMHKSVISRLRFFMEKVCFDKPAK